MLNGKIALVTGGGSGIGRAVCQVMAREGARVVSADIDEASAKETAAMLHGDHMGVMLDVASDGSVAAVIGGIRDKYGAPASCVVNCAGIFPICHMPDISADAFTHVIDVNLKGTFLVTKRAASAMVDAGQAGSIVNIASIAGKNGMACACHYGASKAGVQGFTRSAALELGPKGIRCNAVLPGVITTPMWDAVPELVQRVVPRAVLGRPGRPEEVAELVAFLASDRASYITGASVECTGGM